MEDMAGLDGMMGLIPMAIGAGIVMKVTDHYFGQPQPQKKRSNMKINKNSITRAAGKQNAQLKRANKPVKLGAGNSNPDSSNIFKTVRKSMKGKNISSY